MGWRTLFRRRRDRHTEAGDEIQAHLRMAIADRIARGESPDDARRHALVEFGSVRAALDDARSVWGWTRLEQLWFDAKSGARILKSAPTLSLSAILLVALVIGGNTTIYSAVHAILTKPAPGVTPDRLAAISWLVDGRFATPATTFPYVTALEESALARVAAFRGEQIALETSGGTFAVRGASVTARYFDTLGVALQRGRGLLPDDRLERQGLVAVISERLWQRQFAGGDGAIGAAVRINGRPATIVGIAAGPFQGVWLAEATDLWVPLEAFAQANPLGPASLATFEVDGVVTRRLGDASMAEVEAEFRALAAGAHASAPAGAGRYEPSLVTYTGVAARQNMIANYGPRFLSVFSIVTVLTVCIVCANVANLMLARAVSRQREMAVRQSFGASRWRITRLVLGENLTLSLAGWALACLFASWVSRILPGLIPSSESGGAEVLLDFTPDWIVLAYAMLLALAAAVTFTLAPAVRTWRLDLLSFLRSGERGVTKGRSLTARTLVVIQLSLAVTLLTSAGLAYRSLSVMTGRDLGFPSANMVLVTVDMTSAAPGRDALLPLLRSMLDAVRAVPAVASASFANYVPSQAWPARDVSAGGSSSPVRAERNYVGPGYLRTLGLMPLLGTELDEPVAPPGQRHAVINQHLADALWPGASPLGKVLHHDGQTSTVAGVLPNALIGGYRREARNPIVLFSKLQTASAGSFTTFYVRYRGGIDDAVPAITRAMRDAAPAVPVTYVRTLDGTLHDMTWMTRTLTTLLVLFAAGSLFIAALGQYAAMSFAMGQRVRDFAIRIAMGASARQILGPAMREGLALTAVGLVIGLALGAAAGASGRSLLHGVTPTDATTYAAVFVVLGTASLAACYLPARRAAKVDPIEALRAE